MERFRRLVRSSSEDEVSFAITDWQWMMQDDHGLDEWLELNEAHRIGAIIVLPNAVSAAQFMLRWGS